MKAAILLAITLLLTSLAPAQAQQPAGSNESPLPQTPGYNWHRTDESLALLRDGRIVWQSNHRRGHGKPCLHPVGLADGTTLTWFRPADHPWHRAIWFTWKSINGLVYWDENAEGISPGTTEVLAVKTATDDDHSARLDLDLSFHPPGKSAVLTERRTIRFSPPQADGSYHINWQGTFTAGDQDVVLDRTPIPGQPGGVGHGGYAGMSVRMAEHTRGWKVVNSEGVAEAKTHGPNARWLLVTGKTPSGGPAAVAIFDHPKNLRHPSPWYVTKGMPYYSPAVLFNKPLTLPAGESLTLRYRILIRSGEMDARRVEKQWREFVKPGGQGE